MTADSKRWSQDSGLRPPASFHRTAQPLGPSRRGRDADADGASEAQMVGEAVPS